MPHLIPESAPSRTTRGEKLVFEALRGHLPDSCTAWYNLPLKGRTSLQQPDFILLGDEIGLTVLEVKDWDVRHVLRASPTTWQVQFSTGNENHPNPILQAKGYATTLMDRLKRTQSPLLIERDGPHQGRLRFPFSYWVVFPFMTCAELDGWPELRETLDMRYVLLRDHLGAALFDRLCTQAPFPAQLNLEQVQAIRRVLFPEVCIASSERPVPLLDLDQEQIAKSYLDTDLTTEGEGVSRDLTARLVRGVVGSGKSLILLYRARYLSEVNPAWHTLVLTFNKSLSHYLRQKGRYIGLRHECVRIMHFHGWARALLQEANLWPAQIVQGIRQTNLLRKAQQAIPEAKAFDCEFLRGELQWLKGHRVLTWELYRDVARSGRGIALNPEQRAIVFRVFAAYQRELERLHACDWDDVALRLLDALESGQVKGARYHAILVDEAQDFWPTWFQIVLKLLRPETNMLFMVADSAQKIYRSGFSWKELGIELRGRRVRILKRSYRNTIEILKSAYALIRDEEFLRDDEGEMPPPEFEHQLARHGALPIILGHRDSAQEVQALIDELKLLGRNGYPWHEILVATLRAEDVDRLKRSLQQQDVPALSVGEWDGTNAGRAVMVSTLHSAKGMEYRVVFICGLNAFAHTTDPDELAQNKRLLYVGMTRARERLYLSYHGVTPEWALAKLLPALQALQHS